jgi:predicted DsbA family dithiol-disulfide isomerase
MREHLRRFGAQLGVTDFLVPDRMASTKRALAAAEWARDQGRLHPFRRAVMDAWWREGKDVSDLDVLAAAAARAGLEPAGARAAADDPRYRERIAEIGAEAAAAGVRGIPTFVAGGKAVVGCQPYEVLAKLLQAAGASRRD